MTSEFMDQLYYGEEMMLHYNGRHYFFTGNPVKGGSERRVEDWWAPADDEVEVWWGVAPTREEVRKLFLNAPIFEGKTILEVWDDVVWRDEWPSEIIRRTKDE